LTRKQKSSVTHICLHCKNPYESKAANAKYCKAPDCQAEKIRRWRATVVVSKKGAYQKKPAALKPLRNRPCTHTGQHGEKCRKKTGKNYFFCATHLAYVEDYGMHGPTL